MQARLLARRGDPETSKEAARAVALRCPGLQHWALAWVKAFGPGTTREMSAMGIMVDRGKIHHELARRLPELQRKGLVRVQRDAKGNEVKRGGSRVWEVA